MNTLQFADNLTRLRREKKVTQEELADFIAYLGTSAAGGHRNVYKSTRICA